MYTEIRKLSKLYIFYRRRGKKKEGNDPTFLPHSHEFFPMGRRGKFGAAETSGILGKLRFRNIFPCEYSTTATFLQYFFKLSKSTSRYVLLHIIMLLLITN